MPDSGLRDNNMQWDFWTLSPESAHRVAWLFGDRGLPYTFRQMNGYGSHTFQWINAAGDKVWVKYHLQCDQGTRYLTQEQGTQVAGESPDYYRQDLFGAIESGDFPSWTFYIQVMPLEAAAGYRFNPFDLTKVWPHADFPLQRVGKLTLNRIRTTFSPRSNSPPSSRPISSPGSRRVRTRCCWVACSPSPTPTATESAQITHNCR